MEIKSINLNNFRNAEHFIFQTEFKELIEQQTAEALGISALFAEYLPIYNKEEEAFKIVVKSEKTQLLVNADLERDSTAMGLRNTVKGGLKHYNADVRKASAKIEVVLNSFGDIPSLSYNEATIAINKLIAVLNQDFAAEVAIMGLVEWLSVLKMQNDAFELIMKERYHDSSVKTPYRMKDVRLEIDKWYRAIVKRINARIEVFGEEDYANFVSLLNIRTTYYENLLARRKGRNAKADEDEHEDDAAKTLGL